VAIRWFPSPEKVNVISEVGRAGGRAMETKVLFRSVDLSNGPEAEGEVLLLMLLLNSERDTPQSVDAGPSKPSLFLSSSYDTGAKPGRTGHPESRLL